MILEKDKKLEDFIKYYADRIEKARLREEYKLWCKQAQKMCAQMRAASSKGLYRELDEISSPVPDRDQSVLEVRRGQANQGARIFKIAAQRR